MISLLEISFLNKELRDICQARTLAEAHLGNACADVLRRRLADLFAADTYVDLPLGKPRLTYIEGVECLILNLCEGFYLQFTAGHLQPPRKANGQVDWERVYRVKLMCIGRE